MESPELDWAEATVKDDITFVGWAAQPDPDWLHAFTDVLASWERQVRGQEWRGIAPSADGADVVIEGLEVGAAPAVRQYLAEVCEKATTEAARRARDAAAEQAQAERKSEQSAADAAELQRRLREG